MVDQDRTQAPVTRMSLRIVPLAVACTLMSVNGANAEDPRQPGQPASTGLRLQFAEVPAGQKPDSGPGQPPKPDGDWTLTVGAATLYKPAFLGSKDYQASVFPDFKVEYKDRFFASLFEGVGYNVVNTETWRAGPIMKIDFGRTEDDDSLFRVAGGKTKALRGLGDVDAGLELGGFVEYSFGPFGYSLELRQGLGGHEGLVGETGLNYKGFAELFGKPTMYSVGPRAMFAGANYNDAYFSITQAQSANSGLARYDADAGLVSYGVGAFAVIPVTNSVSLGAFASYDRLTGDAADSPLVKERGDANQFTAGLRISYAFGL